MGVTATMMLERVEEQWRAMQHLGGPARRAAEQEYERTLLYAIAVVRAEQGERRVGQGGVAR